jgi:hypothetical protein
MRHRLTTIAANWRYQVLERAPDTETRHPESQIRNCGLQRASCSAAARTPREINSSLTRPSKAAARAQQSQH